MGWKDFYLGQKPYKGGYIFDLRVDKDTHRLGIGSTLMNEVESIAEKDGIEVMYFSVNGTAIPAINLYTKLNYNVCSERQLGQENDLLDKQEADIKGVKILDMKNLEEGANETIFKVDACEQQYIIQTYRTQPPANIQPDLLKFHSKVDLATLALEPICQKQKYLGTVVVREYDATLHTPSSEIIGLSYVLKKNKVGAMELKRFIFKKEHILTWWARLSYNMMLWLIPFLSCTFTKWLVGWKNSDMQSTFLNVLTIILCGWISMKFNKYFGMAKNLVDSDQTGRLAGNVILVDDNSVSEPIRQMMLKMAAKVAVPHGITNFTMNYDTRRMGADLDKSVADLKLRLKNKGSFMGGKGMTWYMIKDMKNPENVLKLNKVNFFDPSDF
jgi:hypothetical protein